MAEPATRVEQTIFGSPILRDRGPARPGAQHWRALYYFNLYRIALAVFFVTIALDTSRIGILGQASPLLFRVASFGFALTALIFLFTITRGRPTYHFQARAQLFGDVLFLLLLMHASGGASSGLGLLLVVVVAGSGVALGGRRSLFLAAAATVLVLVEHFAFDVSRANSGQIGFLGIALLGTAFLMHAVAQRMRETEALAERRGVDLANLEQLNALVIERMQTGVVAVDNHGTVRMVNDQARQLLPASPAHDGPAPLAEFSTELALLVERWRQRNDGEGLELGIHDGTLLARLLPLGDATDAALIFVEDMTVAERQALQLKLAALGRLTISIAHEIRNPLGAISHAGQLLSESSGMGASDRRMVEIIIEHSRRIDRLIQDVMQLGRKRGPDRKRLDLKKWLSEFARDFETSHPETNGRITLNHEATTVDTDPVQLNQVLFNLCENALHHGDRERPKLTLRCGVDNGSGRSFIEVENRGEPVPAELEERLFEPFFTTSPKGTGLGLFIARELVEGNGARLVYRRLATGACFRIEFKAAK
jgi:two-component system sensor histidine kinase PilS (NtrC family)